MRLHIALLATAACTAAIGGGGNNGNGAQPDASAPSVDAPNNNHGPDAPPPPTIKVLRGVDRASAFSLSEASTLASADGVQWTGVYIGGACSAGSGWTKSLLASMASQLGWTFMPIYVGQQTSSICGADVLTATQGTKDGNDAAAVMATFGWQPNKQIPVCLDLEGGTYSAGPSSAMAYAKAWRDAVRTAGYLAYVYSSPTAIDAFVTGGVAFDGAWPAAWKYTGWASVSPSDLNLGSNYTMTNRAWQYAGSFAVAGAGDVDGDTSDLLLAPAPGGTNL